MWGPPHRPRKVLEARAHFFRIRASGSLLRAARLAPSLRKGGAMACRWALLAVAALGCSRAPAGASGSARAETRDEQLVDHGGEVMAQSTTVAIWWGPREAFPVGAIEEVEGLLAGLGGSALLAMVDQYTRGAGITTRFAGSLFDPSRPPASPLDVAGAAARVCAVLEARGLLPSEGAIYLLYTATPGGPLACAWHGSGACGGATIRVALLPHPAGTSCELLPHFNCGAAAPSAMTLASLTSHELLESITDPLGNGWRDRSGEEMGDKCASTRGCTLLGGAAYELQQEWSNAAHGCALP
jgi:hypothetical protein